MHCVVNQRKDGESGLSQTDAAIIRRHNVVRPDRQSVARKQRFQVLEQETILKNSAGNRHSIDIELIAKSGNSTMQPTCDAQLKCASDLLGAAAALSVCDDSRKQWAKIQFVPVERKWIRITLCGTSSHMFKPHCGLPFEGSLANKAKQGGRRIEQSSHGGCRTRPHLLLQHLRRVVVTFRKMERGICQIWQAIDLSQKSSRSL